MAERGGRSGWCPVRPRSLLLLPAQQISPPVVVRQVSPLSVSPCIMQYCVLSPAKRKCKSEVESQRDSVSKSHDSRSDPSTYECCNLVCSVNPTEPVCRYIMEVTSQLPPPSHPQHSHSQEILNHCALFTETPKPFPTKCRSSRASDMEVKFNL